MGLTRAAWNVLRLILGILLARPRDGLLIALGFMLTALTLAIVLAIPAGLDRIGGSTGQDDVAIVLTATAFGEAGSSLSPEEVNLVGTLPNIARGQDSQPLVAPQFIANAKLARSDGVKTTVQVRGITTATWTVIAPLSARVAGERPRDGRRELLAGNIAAAQHAQLAGATLRLRDLPWRISGRLESGGNLWESELWADMSALQAAYNASGRVSVLWVKLVSADSYDGFAAAVRADPRLQNVRTIRQSEHYRQQLGFVSHFVRLAATGISVLLGAGAALAIANALSAALSGRRREMATLRVLGFRRLGIGLSTLLGVLLLGALATLLAVAIAWLVLDGTAFGTSSGGQAVYARFEVGVGVALSVLAYSLILGLVSALVPIWRVCSGNLVDALRAE